MNSDGTPTSNNKPADAFAAIADAMIQFHDEMSNYDVIGTRIAARTNFILRSVFTILFISSIYLVYMIFQMSSNMSIMTGNLESMYGRFGSMSQDMREITRMVDSMGNSISGIPAIAVSMVEMNEYVGAMNGSVQGMNTSMIAIDNDMAWIDLNMRDMTGRMSNMNRAVNSMSYDVNEMSQPMNSGPMSGFWPR